MIVNLYVFWVVNWKLNYVVYVVLFYMFLFCFYFVVVDKVEDDYYCVNYVRF